MKKNQILNYILILIGSIVAIYAQNDEQQNVLVLVLGIVVLMSGIYRVARQIPSKFDSDDDNHINRDDESI